MFMDLDSDKLYERRIKGNDGHLTDEKKKFCCNCYLDECFQLGCIGYTSDGECECKLDHSR